MKFIQTFLQIHHSLMSFLILRNHIPLPFNHFKQFPITRNHCFNHFITRVFTGFVKVPFFECCGLTVLKIRDIRGVRGPHSPYAGPPSYQTPFGPLTREEPSHCERI
ncbi:hypothetical protein HanPI659440_Chr16g0658721 [Helianthus annuus]|nr:hypothetical protein HanPI659440_Chr16g0658721 [Helianthus annuus]